MGWIGNPGQLMRSTFVESQSVSTDPEISFSTTIGGRRFAQLGPRAHREWSVSMYSLEQMSEISIWQSLLDGEFGPGPFHFIPDLATTTNILTPQTASLTEEFERAGASVLGGPLVIPEGGVIGRSVLLDPGAAGMFFPPTPEHDSAPVIPEVPLTASVYVSGPARMRLYFYDEEKRLSRSFQAPPVGGIGVRRLHVTATPREGEALARMLVDDEGTNRTVRVARPAMTYTPELRPWSTGHGAHSVIVTRSSITPRRDYRVESQAGADFTIVEVG